MNANTDKKQIEEENTGNEAAERVRRDKKKKDDREKDERRRDGRRRDGDVKKEETNPYLLFLILILLLLSEDVLTNLKKFFNSLFTH
ncbi:MAG TPA: hypothetical protein VKY40_04745 [Halanaerobiales bacterium]|nr:hypothetical protein [Halanaerobiales bacterium]